MLNKPELKSYNLFIVREISKSTTSDYNLSQRKINSFGYDFISNGKLKDALKIFRFNVEHFPKPPDVFDSYGETLIELSDVKEGVKVYEKAL